MLKCLLCHLVFVDLSKTYSRKKIKLNVILFNLLISVFRILRDDISLKRRKKAYHITKR